MEGTQTSKRRNRSKSIGSKNLADSPETAPNLNGNKDGGNEEDTTNIDKPTSESPHTPVKPSHGRKRKASELKSDNSGGEEPPNEREIIEPEGKDEQKEQIDQKAESINDTLPAMDGSLSAKQTLGKGKRARIPNKRYSDIILTTSPKLDKSKKVENGEEAIDIIEKENTLDETLDTGYNSPSVAASLKSARNQTGSPATPGGKKLKATVDLTNPNYLKPFQYGWKRELVYRATSDNSLKRNGDIYYYTPSGKKVRSMREVSENLKNKELTLDDFTFYKEPIGLDDPEKEIIRDAKLKSIGKEIIVAPKVTRTPKVTSPKLPPAMESPKAKSSPRTGFKVKLPNKGQTPKGKPEKKPKDDGDMEVGTYPPNWSSPKKTPKWGTNLRNEEKPQPPCSIRCKNVWKPIPTLQCRFCLCLYHNECVGISPLIIIEAYVCKNCQLRQHPSVGSIQTLLPPPPLTPISTIKCGSSVTTALPKLQRIPKQSDVAPPVLLKPPSKQKTDITVDLPKLTPRPGLATVSKYMKITDIGSAQVESKSIVGSLTTWFPPSSTIQVGSSQLQGGDIELQPPPRPQFVEYLGSKKFLIVPKHNILSVSPAIASIGKPEDFVTTPDTLNVGNDSNIKENPTEAAKIPGSPRLSTEISDDIRDIKVEPESPSTLETPQITDPVQQPMDVDPVSNSNKNLPESEPCTIQDDGQEVTRDENQSEIQEHSANIHETRKSSQLSKNKTTPKLKPLVAPAEDKAVDTKYMDNYLQNLAYGYGTLLYVFQYLKVQDLLRAGCVCTMWRDVANHPILWRTVRMKNSQIHSFEGLADTLQKHSTANLDLRKMLLPSGGDEIWPAFSNAIKKVESLRKIELCRCPAVVVEQLAISNPKLEVINAITIKCESMSLDPFANVSHLQELRLKSTAGLSLTSDLSAMKLTFLKHLSLTSIKDLNKLNIDVIADLKNLESLDLGECTDFPNNFGADILSKLDKLEKLRLEKGQGTCYTFEILEAVKNMVKLEQLELVNFDIKAGFDKALGACTNIKKLLIIPTYISQSATTNHMVLGGVLRLQSTLSHFVWGVTLELLRVTELFVDQCEDTDKKDKKEKKPVGNGDSIPVLKPVPLLGDISDQVPQITEPPQVEILPLPNLQKLLLQNLPTTRVKILKIPFHATWRQTITDTVN